MRSISACCCPGPEAQQLATYTGWLMHGVRGGIAAGILFVLPGAFVMLGLSLIYALGQGIPLIEGALFGIKAAVLVIVVEALIRIGKRALKTNVLVAIAAFAFIGIFFLALPFPLIVIGAGLIGYLVARQAPHLLAIKTDGTYPPPVPGRWKQAATAIAIGLAAWWAPVALAALLLGPSHVLVSVGTFFSKLATVSFGGAYALLAYMAQEAVDDQGLADRRRDGGRARPRRNHAGPADPGDAVRRLSRGLSRRGAVLAGHRRRDRGRHDHLGDVHGLDALDLRRRAVRRAIAHRTAC